MNSFEDLKHALEGWPVEVSHLPNHDSVLERIRQILSVWGSQQLDHDLCVLVLQAMGREYYSGRSSTIAIVHAQLPARELWEQHGATIKATRTGFQIEYHPWTPDWLSDSYDFLKDVLLTTPRRKNMRVPADPMYQRLTGFDSYQSAGQRDAVRAAFLMAPGRSLLVNLPTGSGKSTVMFAPALRNAQRGKGTMVVIVPTIALGLDLERSFSEFAQDLGVRWNEALAYHSGLTDDERSRLRNRVRFGEQPIVFAAPEAAMGSLRLALLQAAESHLLTHFCVDEAHIMSTWGVHFRPEFLFLPALRNKLRVANPDLRTILLTGTLTQDGLDSIKESFGAESLDLVSAAQMREEPDVWLSYCPSAPEKEERLLKLLQYLPRPLILYTTEVEDSKRWFKKLRQHFTRIGLMHGKSTTVERNDVLRDWNERKLDLMVGTSAFGLGIDQSDVRSILHACIPETVDRYYQEVGRAGRDGNAAVSVVVYDQSDWATVNSLATSTQISQNKGLMRWEAMLAEVTRSVTVNNEQILEVSLDARHPGIKQDSDENRKWNRRTLILLERAGWIESRLLDPPEQSADEEVLDTYFRATAFVLKKADHLNEAAWAEIEDERKKVVEAEKSRLQQLQDFFLGRASLREVLSDLYKLEEVYPGVVTGTCPRERESGVGRKIRSVSPLLVVDTSHLLQVSRGNHLDLPILIKSLKPDTETVGWFMKSLMKRGFLHFVCEENVLGSLTLPDHIFYIWTRKNDLQTVKLKVPAVIDYTQEKSVSPQILEWLRQYPQTVVLCQQGVLGPYEDYVGHYFQNIQRIDAFIGE